MSSDVSYDVRTGGAVAHGRRKHGRGGARRRRPSGRGGTRRRGRHPRRAPPLAGRGRRRHRDPQTAAELLRVADRETALGEGPADRRDRPVCRPAALLRRRRRGGLVPAGGRRPPHGHGPRPAPDAGAARPGRGAGGEQLPVRVRGPGQRHRLGARRRMPGGRQGAPGPSRDQRAARGGRHRRARGRRRPGGAFGLVAGFEAGEALVRAPEISAVAFTGSQRAGSHCGGWRTSAPWSSPCTPRWAR